MKITDEIYMLEISANVMGGKSVINPILLLDNNSVILVDTGFPGQLNQIRESIEKEGIQFNKINKIILTHQDIDHVGCASAIAKEISHKVNILAHEEEAPFINGEKKPVKLAGLEANLDNLPDSMKVIYEKMKAGFASSRVEIDNTFTDGEELPYCGGITVIHTPGHTPGHVCLYLKQSKILIAGDSLKIEEGQLALAAPSINLDSELNIKSLNKLINYDIEAIICYHGGIYKGNVKERISELINGTIK